MVGSTLFEVFGSVVSSLTRGVGEHLVDTNEDLRNSDSFGYNTFESTSLEWDYHPVGEFIYEEYGNREVSNAEYLTVNQRTDLHAFSPEHSEDTVDEIEDTAMLWKLFRPSLKRTIMKSLYFGFLISFLSALLTGSVSIFGYYMSYQVRLVCLARHNQSAIPIEIQWSKTASAAMTGVFSYNWFTLNTLFFFRSYQIKEVKQSLFLVSYCSYVLFVFYRLLLQENGIYYSVWTPLLRIPDKALFALDVCVQTWIIAKHFSTGNGAKKLKTFILLIVSCAVPITMGLVVANFIYPAYDKQEQTGKILIATFTPLIFVILKVISRFSVQRLWRISHPGRAFAYLVPAYYGSAVMTRLLQVDLVNVKSITLIGIIHGLAEVIERSVVVFIDYLYHRISQRKTVAWKHFRSPRLERLATDIAIISMLYEASAVISVNGFLHLHEYFYTNNKTCPQIIQSFVITTSVPLSIEWFFSGMTIAIETHFQNRPIFAVWRKQWRRHLILAIINAVLIVIWSSTTLLVAIKGQFPDMKDYCELPFTRM